MKKQELIKGRMYQTGNGEVLEFRCFSDTGTAYFKADDNTLYCTHEEEGLDNGNTLVGFFTGVALDFTLINES